jgi:hypothetical protein
MVVDFEAVQLHDQHVVELKSLILVTAMPTVTAK